MSYWAYYLFWAVLAFGLRTPYLLAGVLVFLALRRFIPDPSVLLRTWGRVRALRAQIEANPANAEARRDLARIYLERRRPGRALGLLDEALGRDPGSAELHYLKGLALHRKGDHEAALGPLVRAVELDPRVAFGEPYLAAADALAALRRWEQAEDAYLRYLDTNSSAVGAHVKLARVLQKRGRAAEARAALAEARGTFALLPGFARRKQLGGWLSAQIARATVAREPLAIALALALLGGSGAAALAAGRAALRDLRSRDGFLPREMGMTWLLPPLDRTRFVVAPAELGLGTAKVKNRWAFDDLQNGREARMSTGDFACRLAALFGPPPREAKGFGYVLRDTRTGLVVTAYSAGSGPAYGARLFDPATRTRVPPAEEARARAAIDELDALVDATPPIDCEVRYVGDAGPMRSGVRRGVPYDDAEGEEPD